jgi:NADPH-dependent glutamate synthase beta subunit-like oxidoreductase
VGGRIAEWIHQVLGQDYYGAWMTLADNNPFPAIAGRICHHPCESACNRQQHDETVSICSLERFVGDMALSEGWRFPQPSTSRDESIAIVGGGPAGLSAAYQLRRQGYRVTLFESRDQLGGLLRHGIPAYRLDKDVMDGEIQRIVDLGVEIRLNAEIASSDALRDLRGGFDAVYLATGATRSKTLPSLDYDRTWVTDSADFLAATNAGKPCTPGERLVVIGGGSAAMDVARTARRLNKSVTVLSLEPESQLPAQRVEVDEALEEGVDFVTGAMMQFVNDGDDGLTLACIRVDFQQGDERGVFTIDPVEGSDFTLNADAIVPAIGQDVDLHLWSGVLDADGPVVRTNRQWQTAMPGIFAGGDVASMDRFVTRAIGMGKQAAAEIARYLDPQHFPASAISNPEVGIAALNTDYYPPADRHHPATAEVADRLADFQEVQKGLDPEEAVAEAGRCFSCGTCIFCDNCYLYCPDMAITKLDRGYAVKLDYCKGCGLCVAECPTGSISMQEEA